MKIFTMVCEMFDAGRDYPTQDIEFNSTPAIELADAKTTRETLGLRLIYDADKTECTSAYRSCPIMSFKSHGTRSRINILSLFDSIHSPPIDLATT